MTKLVRFLVIAIVLGVIIGLTFGERVAFLGEAGSLTIRILKGLATPLLFFGIVDTFCKTRIEARDGIKLCSLSLINACAALLISLTIAHLVPLERLLDLHAIQNQLPKSVFSNPALDSHSAAHSGLKDPGVIPVVFLAVLIGVAIRSTQYEFKGRVTYFFAQGFVIIQRILNGFVQIIPLAVFCVVAKIIGSSGLALLPTLGVFVATVVLGMFIQAGIYYAVLLKLAGFSPRKFFRDGSSPLITAFSTGSSLATLPVTLNTLEEKMKISTKYARLAAAIGTNLNHDGILLYEAMAALFVARLYGIHLSIPQQITVAGTSVVAAVGIAGVPEAGLITLSLVLNAVGLPLQAVALLLPVDWLIGRLRATVNVASDMTVAHLLQRLGRP